MTYGLATNPPGRPNEVRCYCFGLGLTVTTPARALRHAPHFPWQLKSRRKQAEAALRNKTLHSATLGDEAEQTHTNTFKEGEAVVNHGFGILDRLFSRLAAAAAAAAAAG
eukprot:875855-Amphidinium_carterae.1